MAQDVRPLPGVAPPEGAEGAETTSASGIDIVTEKRWHFLTSMRFAVVLILILAALALIGTLIIQMPAGVSNDAQARTEWLAGVRPKYGGWTGILDQVGMFEVFTSIWFRATVIALAISLLACSAHRLRGMWRTATKPNLDIGESFFDHAPEHHRVELKAAPGEVSARVSEVLRHHHYTTTVHDGGTVHVYGDRFRWAPFGSIAAHLSLILILAGSIVGSMFGYRDDQFMLAEGASADVPTMPGVAITLKQFKDSYYTENGAPSDYASDLVITRDGTVVAEHTARVNDPMRFGDLSFYQSFYGPAVMLKVSDASGAVLASDGVPLAWDTNDGQHRIGTFALPAQDLTFWVVGTAGGSDPTIKPGQVQIEAYRASGDGSAVATQVIDQGKPTSVAGLTFTFVRETQFTGLSVSRDPGAPLIWLGGLLLFLGVVMVFLFPHRRVWGRLVARPGGGTSVAFAAEEGRGSGFDAELERLVSEVGSAAAAPGTQQS